MMVGYQTFDCVAFDFDLTFFEIGKDWVVLQWLNTASSSCSTAS